MTVHTNMVCLDLTNTFDLWIHKLSIYVEFVLLFWIVLKFLKRIAESCEYIVSTIIIDQIGLPMVCTGNHDNVFMLLKLKYNQMIRQVLSNVAYVQSFFY